MSNIKEEFIKKHVVGEKKLIHRRFRDDAGVLTDSFEINVTTKNGVYCYPVLTPPALQNYGGETDLMDQTTEYTIEDYERIINKFNNL